MRRADRTDAELQGVVTGWGGSKLKKCNGIAEPKSEPLPHRRGHSAGDVAAVVCNDTDALAIYAGETNHDTGSVSRGDDEQ